jgi:peptidylprolyl isomerase
MRQQALELRKQITDGHGDFAALARQRSDDKTTAQNGGEIGWLREEVLLPPIRQALSTMAPGAVSDPVRTPDGWHLVLLVGVQPAGQATQEEARPMLVRLLRQERSLQAQRTYLNDLLQDQPIKVDQVELWKQVAQ